jgi:hypothetical protein
LAHATSINADASADAHPDGWTMAQAARFLCKD